MRRTILIAAALLVTAPAFAQDWNGDDDLSYDAQDQYAPDDQGPAFEDFRRDSELSWNGEWIDTPEYGTVWRPTHVDSDWRPYTYGHWAYTDYGWTWVSDESFGWAVYHYGRWAFMDDVGWVWLPGRVWAPAWVAWRYGDGVMGWCALGPRQMVWERPRYWVFVESRYALEPVRHHAMPIQVTRTYFERAHVLPVRTWAHAGPPRTVVERDIGREIHPVRVVRVGQPQSAQGGGSVVPVYRPHPTPMQQRPPEQRPVVRPYSSGVPSQGGIERHRSDPRPDPSPRPRVETHGAAPIPAQPQPKQERPVPAPQQRPVPAPAPRPAPKGEPAERPHVHQQ